ncbi:tetratricopeptide repeat domain protein [Desulfurobacterium thermolithotrophum DSM 11699]|uniref:Tetratricopeptide repeat domain protein n=1 Tax=Desulfurobacterium thermolithotrophum (strain DSM 11699 / BSA) TaxID=868864 RepID=F0S0R1_DESTD|nr:tetratricopeptide repeat protein [Desulfurobacterium thermolithotrophum]ADY73864.1 tetratricopeptide repeat domain protein [Desulfurobacterium thermolithotrophum DSM 11699]
MKFLNIFISLLIILDFSTSLGYDYKTEKESKLYEKGVKQLEIGSYSTALEYFLRLLNPQSKYYEKTLLMLSKTYYGIGKKTGEKKYLWQALNYLQLYFIAKKDLPWDYYFMKAKIYESLGFYEQALAIYRVAFLKTETESQRIETTIGILRTAVEIRRIDIVDEYYILISTAKLSPKQEQEVEFVKGLLLFSKGKYKEALPHFFKVYRKYETYLLDNPEYYYLVAENIYRVGNLVLAEQLFRRIISLTRNQEIIRKSTIRLGDIELKKGNLKLALVYYYSVIREAPQSQEAIVARLKLIPLQKYPVVKYRLSLTNDSAFKDPIKYIAKVLVTYRTTYVGIYALTDLGYLIFSLNSPSITFKRLVWEVSLVFPEQVKYEQREFLRSLWTPYLLKLESKKMCELYRSNTRFFKEIFDREVLLKIANDLKSCNMRKLRIDLLKYMVKKWNSDSDIILMAQALFESRDFKDALKILKKVKNKNRCDYEKLYLKISMFISTNFLFNEKRLENLCRKNKKDSSFMAIKIFYLSKNLKLEEAYKIFKENKIYLKENYNKSAVVKLAINNLIEKLMANNHYSQVYNISKTLLSEDSPNCYLGSITVISAVRIGKINDVKKVSELIRECKDKLSDIAITVYDNAILEKELTNE